MKKLIFIFLLLLIPSMVNAQFKWYEKKVILMMISDTSAVLCKVVGNVSLAGGAFIIDASDSLATFFGDVKLQGDVNYEGKLIFKESTADKWSIFYYGMGSSNTLHIRDEINDFDLVTFQNDSTAVFHGMVYINQTYTEPTNGISDSTILIISNNNVGNGVAILSILARSSGASAIFFGDQTSEGLGRIIYDHDYNAKPQMEFWSDSYRIMTLRDSSVGIGVIDPDSTLEVNGSLHVTGNGIFDGKLTTSGVVDPPAVTFTAETRKTIKEKWLPTIDTEHEKVMVFWNSELEQMEVYHIEKDIFYPLSQKNRLAIIPYFIMLIIFAIFVGFRRKK